MLHAPLLVPTAKLDISLLLKSSPSPPPPNSHPPLSRSISVPATGSHQQAISSPSTSTTSQYSTSTAPPNPYQAPPQPPFQQQQQLQIHSQRRPGPSLPGPALASAASLSKRPPPTTPHPSASPAKKHNSKWGPDEDALIISLRGSGMKWEDISKKLPGRSVIACRLHYQNYLERRTPWDEEKKDKLARLYDRMKPEMWAKVAEDLQVPWRAAESMHWALGEQEMARRAGVVPFSMAPAGYAPSAGTAGGPVGSSSSSASGMEPSAYMEPSAHEVGGRLSSGRRDSYGYGSESESGIGLTQGHAGGHGDYEAGREDVGGRRRRRPISGPGGQGVVLPSLAEFEGGVPAYAGFVSEMRGIGEGARESRGSPEEEEHEDDGGRGR